MIQLFSTLLLGLSYIQETICAYYNKYKQKIIKINHIRNIQSNENVFYKYICSKYIYDYDTTRDDYFCEFNNNYGTYRIILKNTTLKDIIKIEDDINKDKNNLTDGLYENKLITSIYLKSKSRQNFRLNIMDYIMYIDKNINLTLKDILKIYHIDYSQFDLIEIKYMSYDDYSDSCIESSIEAYLDKNLAQFL